MATALPKIREGFLPKVDSANEMPVEPKCRLPRQEVVGSLSERVLKIVLGSYLM